MYTECLAQTQVALVSAGVTTEKRIKHGQALSVCPSPQAALLISLLHAYLLFSWQATVQGASRVRHDLAAKQKQQQQIPALSQPHPTLVKCKLKINPQKENFALYNFP